MGAWAYKGTDKTDSDKTGTNSYRRVCYECGEKDGRHERWCVVDAHLDASLDALDYGCPMCGEEMGHDEDCPKAVWPDARRYKGKGVSRGARLLTNK